MPTLLSQVAPQVVIMTTRGATSDSKVGIMTTQDFLWLQLIWRSGSSRFHALLSSMILLKFLWLEKKSVPVKKTAYTKIKYSLKALS